MATMRLPRPRHGDSLQTTEELRALAAAILRDDVQTLARTTAYLRRSYRVVFIGYVAMMTFGVAAIVAAFVKGMTAANVSQAVVAVGLAGLTVGIFIAFLLIYRSHLIRVTDKLRIAVFAATGGVALVYLASLVLNLVGVQVSYLNEAMAGSGVLGIAVNVLVIGIAAFNLLLDFDLADRGVAARAPKYMEWYVAFALLVTLVWLYIELLRLLSRLARR